MTAERLLVRAPNWLGDAVLALPAMAAVRARYPDSSLAIAGPSTVTPLFEEGTGAAQDELVPIVDVGKEAALLRTGRFDAALLFPNSFGSAWTCRQAGIPQRWGYAGNLRSPLLTRAVRRPRGRHHQAAWYLNLVRGLGVTAADVLPRVEVTAASRQRAWATLAAQGVAADLPVVGVAPGAAYGHAKRWPPARMADLIARLHARGARCVMLGVGGDRDAGREIESTLPQGAAVVNLIGRTDLRLLAGILASCHAFVSNDSGGMHLAAACGVPVTAIFGPTDERVTAPVGDHDVLIHQVFCRPCMLRDCPIDHRCMKGITVDAVASAVIKRMDARGPARLPR